MAVFFERIFPKYQTDFLKRLSAQKCLKSMYEKCWQCLDLKDEYAALLADVSRVVDFLLHDLIIAKLRAYGFDLPWIRLIFLT